MSKKLTNKGAITASIATMMGTGTVFMPMAFKLVGYINGIIITAAVSVSTFFSCYSMAKVTIESKQKGPTYSSLALNMSRKLYYVVSFSLFLNSYLPAMNYYKYLTIIISKNIDFIFNFNVKDEDYLRKVVLFVLILPFLYMVLRKQLSSLYAASYLCVFSVAYMALLNIFIYTISEEMPAEKKAKPFNSSFLEALPFFIGSMVCQGNIVKVFGEMENISEKDIIIVSLGSAIGGFLINVIIGLFGYLAIGDTINSELLTIFSDKNHEINVYLRKRGDTYNIISKTGVFGFILVLFSGFPIQFCSLTDIIFGLVPKKFVTENNRKKCVVFLFLICISIAYIKDLEIKAIRRFSGAVCSSPVAFIYPYIYYIFQKKSVFGVTQTIGFISIIVSIFASSLALYNLFISILT